MAVQNPPLWLQDGSYPAVNYRSFLESAFKGRSGVFRELELEVKAQATADMTVEVTSGSVLVKADSGTSLADMYFCKATSSTDLTISASHSTLARYDLVVARVEDDARDSGGVNSWNLEVVEGTAAATPLFPAIPDYSFVLAVIKLPAGAGSVITSYIHDVRNGSWTDDTTTIINRGSATAQGGVTRCTSSNMPSEFVQNGDLVYQTDTDRLLLRNSSTWDIIRGSVVSADLGASITSIVSGSPTALGSIQIPGNGNWRISANGFLSYSGLDTDQIVALNIRTVTAVGTTLNYTNESVLFDEGNRKGWYVETLYDSPGITNIWLTAYREDSTGTLNTNATYLMATAV